jgi:hypothetical protein
LDIPEEGAATHYPSQISAVGGGTIVKPKWKIWNIFERLRLDFGSQSVLRGRIRRVEPLLT